MKRNRWFWILLIGLCILLLSSAIACAPDTSSAPTAEPTVTEQPKNTSAQFKVSALSVKPDTVMVGYPALVTATVTNNGDVAGTYTAYLLINGEEIDGKYIWLAPGATEDISFQVTRTTAGSCELTIGDAAAKLNVCDWTPCTIKYDSGEYDPLLMGVYIWGGGGHIVHFTPVAKPFKIQKVSISAHTKVENFPDLNKRTFKVRIWNERKTEQLWSDDFPWSLFTGGGWKEVDIPDIITDGDFHVEVVTNSDAPPAQDLMAINYEESKGEVRSGVSYMGEVSASGGYYAKDKRWFIRVSGQGPPETCVPIIEQAEVKEESTDGQEAELTIPSTELVHEDDFSDPSSGWDVESTAKSEFYYKDGEYHIKAKDAKYAVWISHDEWGELTDFIFEADTRLVDGPKNSRAGLIFRLKDSENFYLFLVSGDGSYLVGTRTGGQWTVLKNWTESEFINEGYGGNHLKVICKGSKVEAFVNGHHLTTVVTEESFAIGQVGLMIDTIEPNGHVAFDNLKVYIPAD